MSSYHHGDLRTALLSCAAEILAESGVSGLSLRGLARKAGVSHAAPYRHFCDKDALMLAVIEQGFSLMHATMEAKQAEVSDDPINQFEASGQAYLAFALAHPAYYRVMFSGDLLSSKGGMDLQHTANQAFTNLLDSIKAAQDLGVLKAGNPRKLALVVWSTIHGFTMLAIDQRLDQAMDEPCSVNALYNETLSAVFTGLANTNLPA